MYLNMKKLYIFLAAAVMITGSACTKEELDGDKVPVKKEVRTFVVSFDGSEDTRTDITKQGKTVWAEGDKIWVSNGTESDTLTVGAQYDGQRYCEFNTELQGTIYVVYPMSAAKGVDENGKFQIQIPRIQDGTFGSANIACAVAADRYVKMKNVTSVLKFRIPADAKAIKVVSVNAVNNPVAGDCSVDLSSGTPVVTASETSSDVIVKVDGLAGNFYASVLPGTYNAGFTMTAVALDLANAVETRATSETKEMKVNDLYDLGRIGEDLKPLGGSGSEGDPYQVSSLPEFLAITYFINDGNKMEGKAIKLTGDINGVTTPIGIYDETDSKNVVDLPFQGTFDGGGHTVTLNMDQAGSAAVGLFANLGHGAKVSNVNVAGTVKSNYLYAGGLAGYVVDTLAKAGEVGISLKDCKSSANVSGKRYVGGLFGMVSSYYITRNGDKVSYTYIETIPMENCSNSGNVIGEGDCVGGVSGDVDGVSLKNCSNSGAVGGTYNVGGVAGYCYMGSMTDCSNSGSVTSTADAGYFFAVVSNKWRYTYRGGSGGVAGYSQNVVFNRCSNSGTIMGYSKTGGIAGTMYIGTAKYCENTGSITTEKDAVGGIIGWNCVQGRIYQCVNKGEIKAQNTKAGGIVGYVDPVHTANATWANMIYQRCTNEGKVSTDVNTAGGIVGYAWVMNNVSKLTIDGCNNKGEVIGPKWIGGVMGSEGRYSNWSRVDIYNCENHGKITGTNTGNDVFVGGIFGGPVNYTKSQGQMISNCYNTGEILYGGAEATSPKAGGIAGHLYHGAGFVKNSYNSGRVGPVEGNPVEGAVIGAIIGFNQSVGANTNNYYLEGSCPTAFGAKSGGTLDATAVDTNGNLATSVTINGKNCASVVDALNAWRNGNLTYFGWVAGPAFSYPSFSEPVDGGYDIGNGGEI